MTPLIMEHNHFVVYTMKQNKIHHWNRKLMHGLVQNNIEFYNRKNNNKKIFQQVGRQHKYKHLCLYTKDSSPRRYIFWDETSEIRKQKPNSETYVYIFVGGV